MVVFSLYLHINSLRVDMVQHIVWDKEIPVHNLVSRDDYLDVGSVEEATRVGFGTWQHVEEVVGRTGKTARFHAGLRLGPILIYVLHDDG